MLLRSDDAALRGAEYASCSPAVPVKGGSRAKIVKVVDGDTFHIAFLREGEVVRTSARLTGVDTPEMKSHDPTEAASARAARAWLEGKAQGRMCTVCTGAGADKYGRALVDVLLDGESETLSRTMLAQLPGDQCRPYSGGAKAEW